VLRLTVVAIVACSPASAEPADRAHPPGWQQLPAITGAITTAARAGGATVEAVDAWGEPAAGCYAVWLGLRGRAADAAALADQVLTGAAGLAPSEVARPTGADGVLAFGFARPPYRGRVRARLGDGRISAVACFGNQREPVACDAACAGVVQGVP
jgi:hypothetical protein